jgi:hypothetical protein
MVGVGEPGDPAGGGGEQDPVPGLAGADRQPGGQVRLACPGSDGDRLQHLRAVLPCRVRVTAVTHPLAGELLAASGFRRFAGVVHLVVALPDGSPGTIRADATDVLAAVGAEPGPVGVVLDAGGVRALRELVAALRGSPPSGRRKGK